MRSRDPVRQLLRGILLLALVAQLATAAARAAAGGGASSPPPGAPGKLRFAVGEIYVTYTDPRRRIRLPDGRSVPRQVVTLIRYPARTGVSGVDVRGAPPAKHHGPFPLIVFGHGFAVTPAIYARLLRAWTAAGYVVAAPIFPLGNAHAPGGPNEADLVNQPADMSLVITRVLAANSEAAGILAHLINPRQIAVSGQSDGGSTALAVVYNDHDADRRVQAAIILSGAQIPGLDGYDYGRLSRPLLASQGTADTVNSPSSTYSYYRRAGSPKFLLSLLGAGHLGPYTDQQPQLRVVERTSIAFLDRYLKGRPAAGRRLRRAGNTRRVSTLTVN